MLGIDRVRRRDRKRGAPPDDRPLLLAHDVRQRRVVDQCCQRARDAGVRPGTPVAEAKAVLPAGRVRIEDADPRRDSALLRSLAEWAHRFSPMVATDEPDGLLIDVTGCDRTLGGEPAIAAAVLDGLRALALHARCAIAPTIGSAWAMARATPPSTSPPIIDDGHLRPALEPLPVRALRIDDDAAAALADVGIDRIAQLIGLPRSVLPARFGDHVLMRLDQALGAAIETLHTIRHQEPITTSRAFDGPCTQPEAIAIAVRDLIANLCAQMQSIDIGARRIEITLDRADLDPARVVVTMSRASRQVRHIWALVSVRLERVNLGHGVDDIHATALQCVRLPHEQREWDRGPAHTTSAKQNERDIGELIDAMATRFGRGRVLEAHTNESHRPERAFAWREASAGAKRAPSTLGPTHRPTILFERPAPIEASAITPDGPVVHLTWRAQTLTIRTTIGPERLAGEWWRRAEPTRDYFKVQDEHGRWLWVFREVECGGWYVHGMWG